MSSGLARYSAMLSALLTLVAAAYWLLHGAPDVPDINSPGFESRNAADAFFQSGLFTFALVMLSSMHHAVPWLSRAALAMTCASIVVSAGVSLYLLRRESPDGYLRYLGLALGWWSLGFGYLWLFSVVRSAGVQPAGVMWRLVLDAAAFQLVLAAGTATLAFVASFPRRVPQEELMRFLTALWRRQSRFLGLVHGTTAPAGDTVLAEVPMRKRLRVPLWVTAVVVLGLSLFWRPSSLSPGAGSASLLMLLAFVAFCALVARPVVSALRHFKFHRLTGSPEERRRIARLQISLAAGAALVLLFVAVLVCLSLGAGVLPGLRPGAAVGRVLELSVFAGQLVSLLCLLLAVFSRPRQEAAP